MVANCLTLHEMQREQPGSRDHRRPCGDDDLIGRKYDPVRAKPYQTRHHHPEDEHHHAQPWYLANDLRGVWRFPSGRSLLQQFQMFLILRIILIFMNESFCH